MSIFFLSFLFLYYLYKKTFYFIILSVWRKNRKKKKKNKTERTKEVQQNMTQFKTNNHYYCSSPTCKCITKVN